MAKSSTAKVVKGLEIEFSLDPSTLPKYTFVGEWSGKDLRVVFSTIRRAYYRHQQSIRHANEAVNATLLKEKSDESTV